MAQFVTRACVLHCGTSTMRNRITVLTLLYHWPYNDVRSYLKRVDATIESAPSRYQLVHLATSNVQPSWHYKYLGSNFAMWDNDRHRNQPNHSRNVLVPSDYFAWKLIFLNIITWIPWTSAYSASVKLIVLAGETSPKSSFLFLILAGISAIFQFFSSTVRNCGFQFPFAIFIRRFSRSNSKTSTLSSNFVMSSARNRLAAFVKIRAYWLSKRCGGPSIAIFSIWFFVDFDFHFDTLKNDSMKNGVNLWWGQIEQLNRINSVFFLNTYSTISRLYPTVNSINAVNTSINHDAPSSSSE